jgi:flagellar motor switch protein FliN/FliY
MADSNPDIRGTQAASAAASASASAASPASATGSAGGAVSGPSSQPSTLPLVADALHQAAQTAKDIGTQAAAAAGLSPESLALPDFAAGDKTQASAFDLGLLDDVALRVKVELGRTHMYVEDVLRLNTSSVVELDKAAGDPVDIYVNDRHVARGEVLVLNENFCVRVSEIIQQVGTEK